MDRLPLQIEGLLQAFPEACHRDALRGGPEREGDGQVDGLIVCDLDPVLHVVCEALELDCHQVAARWEVVDLEPAFPIGDCGDRGVLREVGDLHRGSREDPSKSVDHPTRDCPAGALSLRRGGNQEGQYEDQRVAHGLHLQSPRSVAIRR